MHPSIRFFEITEIGKILTSDEKGMPIWAYPVFYFYLPRKLKKFYKKFGRLPFQKQSRVERKGKEFTENLHRMYEEGFGDSQKYWDSSEIDKRFNPENP